MVGGGWRLCSRKMKTSRFIRSNSLHRSKGKEKENRAAGALDGVELTMDPWASIESDGIASLSGWEYMVPFLVWSPGLETCGSPSHLVRQLVRHLVPSPQLWIIATS